MVEALERERCFFDANGTHEKERKKLNIYITYKIYLSLSFH